MVRVALLIPLLSKSVLAAVVPANGTDASLAGVQPNLADARVQPVNGEPAQSSSASASAPSFIPVDQSQIHNVTGTDESNTLNVTRSEQSDPPSITGPLDPKWSNALKPHDQATYPPHAMEVDYWCNNVDTTDAEAVRVLWEEKGVGVWFGLMTRPADDKDESLETSYAFFYNNYRAILPGEHGPDKWPIHIFNAVQPGVGNPGLGGCGVVGGQCSPNLQMSCADMVKNGNGAGGYAYWSLQALAGFQSKLNTAHEYLQDATLDNLLSLGEISKDFTAPDGFAALKEMAGILSSCLFLVGGVAGVASAGIGAAIAGAGISGRVGAAEAKLATVQANLLKYNMDGLRAAENELQAARDALASATDAQRRAGSLSAGVYLIGSTFSTISAGTLDDGTGQVEAGDLEPVLKELFNNARDSLATIGKLGTGGGGDYSQLPHQNGSGANSADGSPLSPHMYIAGLFADGKMLLGEANPAFNQSIQAGFQTFKPKLVDQALQTAGWHVLAREELSKPEYCKDNGQKWLVPDGTKGFCFEMYRNNPSGVGPCPGDYSTCSWVPGDDKLYKLITDKYGIKLEDYYMASYKCTTAKRNGNMPDVVNLPLDGSLPVCWYAIKASKAKETDTCTGFQCNANPDVRFELGLSDF